MWNVSAPTVIGVRVLNEFCEAIPRYSSSRGTRFKRRIGNLDDEEQQIKWAIGWLDALLFNRRKEVERNRECPPGNFAAARAA